MGSSLKISRKLDSSVIKRAVLLYSELNLHSPPQFGMGFLEKADTRLQQFQNWVKERVFLCENMNFPNHLSVFFI